MDLDLRRIPAPFPDPAAVFSDCHFRVDRGSNVWRRARSVFVGEVHRLESEGVTCLLDGDCVDYLAGTSWRDIYDYDPELGEILRRLQGVIGNHERNRDGQVDPDLAALGEAILWEDGTLMLHGDPRGAVGRIEQWFGGLALWLDSHELVEVSNWARIVRDAPEQQARVFQTAREIRGVTRILSAHTHRPGCVSEGNVPLWVGSNGWGGRPPWTYLRREDESWWVEAVAP